MNRMLVANHHTLGVKQAACAMALAVILGASPATAAVTQSWTATYDSGSPRFDQAVAINMGGGAVYVAGRSDNGADPDYALIRYTSGGSQQWVAAYHYLGADLPVALAADAGGNAYITGTSYVGYGVADVATLKYGPASSTPLWTVRYDNAGAHDESKGMAVDSSGNVYIAVKTSANGGDAILVKYDSSGIFQWAVPFGGMTTAEEPVGVGVDASGNIYMAGRYTSNGADDFFIAKYSSGGVLQWNQMYNSGGDDIPAAMAVDSSGNVYVTGKSIYGAADYRTVKYDAGGTLQWAALYDGGSTDNAVALAVGAGGAVYVTGSSFNGTDYDIATIKYTATGVQSWVAVEGGLYDQQAAYIAVDGADNVYVTGSTNYLTGIPGYLTAAYNSSGTKLWLAAPSPGSYAASGVAVVPSESAGGAYVTGTTRNAAQDDITTIKYTAGIADLTPTTVTGPALSAPGGTITLQNSIKNQGAGPANNFNAEFFLVPQADQQVFFDDFENGVLAPWTTLGSGVISETGGVLLNSSIGYPNGGTAPLSSPVNDFELQLFTKRTATSANTSHYAVVGASGGYAASVRTSDDSFLIDHYDGANGAWTATTTLADNGRSLQFDGANTYVDLGDKPALRMMGDQTIEMWIKADADGYSQRRNLFAKAYGGEGSIVLESTGLLSYYYGTCGGDCSPYQGVSSLAASAVLANTWTHIAIVRDLTNMKLRWYVNGAAAGEATALYSMAAGSLNSAYIGKGHLSNFKGLMDDVAVWNKALTATEIASRYNSGQGRALAGTESGLTGYWRFNALSGNTASDLSSNQLTGTVNSGIWSTTRSPVDALNLKMDQWYTVFLKKVNSSITASLYEGKVERWSDAAPLTTISAADSTYATFSNVSVVGGGDYVTDDLRVHKTGYTANLANKVALGSRVISAVGVDQTNTDATAMTIPSGMAAGNYYLGVTADSGGIVTELSESNNVLIEGRISLYPDLVVSTVSGPATATTGGMIAVQNTITNQSPQMNCTAFEVQIYLSTDNIIETTDTLLGSRTVSTCVPGNGSSTATTTVTIPSGLAGGYYYLGVLADGLGAVAEGNEYNNAGVAAQRIGVSNGADLTVSSMTGVPLAAVLGDSISINTTVTNLGTGMAGVSELRFYLSTDATITGADTCIGSRSVPSLAAGGVSSAATNLVLTGVIPGIYYLGAIADGSGAVPETNETNNTTAGVPITLYANAAGDGRDGSVTVSSTFWMSSSSSNVFGNTADRNGGYADGFSAQLTADVTAGATTLAVSSSVGFVVGDEVLVIQMRHDAATSNAGAYEFAYVSAIPSGTGLTLTSALSYAYYGATGKAQVVRVPHYRDLTVPVGTTLTTNAYDDSTSTGGIIAFRVSGSLTVNGAISAQGVGFAGGPGVYGTYSGGNSIMAQGRNGASYRKADLATALPTGGTNSANDGGGAGGGWRCSNCTGVDTGGGGGGYGTTGQDSVFYYMGATYAAAGGGAYGIADLSRLFLGSGGGSGSTFYSSTPSGQGGNGGGIVYIGAHSVNLTGAISANGAAGGNTVATYGSGGGGAGGSIYLRQTASSGVNPALVTINGGSGGTTNWNRPGGAGGSGRVVIKENVPVDLTVTALTGPASAAAGNAVTLNNTVANSGDGIAGPSDTGLYLVPQKTRNYLTLNGVNDRVEIYNAPVLDFNATQSLTVSAWVKTTIVTAGTQSCILSKANKTVITAGNFPNYHLRLDGYGESAKAVFALNDGTFRPAVTGASNVGDGKWHHIVGVRNVVNATIAIYVDGNLEATVTDTTTATLENDGSLEIGRFGGGYGGCYFKGSINGVAIYNTALTAASVAGLYNGGSGVTLTGAEAGLVGYWPFSEGSGTTILDATANANHGYFTSTVTDNFTTNTNWTGPSSGSVYFNYVQSGKTTARLVGGYPTYAMISRPAVNTSRSIKVSVYTDGIYLDALPAAVISFDDWVSPQRRFAVTRTSSAFYISIISPSCTSSRWSSCSSLYMFPMTAALNTWYTVEIEYDAATGKVDAWLYADGGIRNATNHYTNTGYFPANWTRYTSSWMYHASLYLANYVETNPHAPPWAPPELMPNWDLAILLGNRHVPTMGPVSNSSDATAVTISASVTPGTYYLGAMADTGNTVTESNETNNRLLGPQITIVASGGFFSSLIDTVKSIGGGGALGWAELMLGVFGVLLLGHRWRRTPSPSQLPPR